VQQFQAKIEKALRGRSQSPQVVVVIGDGVGDTVTVMGDVKSPGRRPLTAAHERVLDILAISGGPAGAKADTLVRLTRGDQWAEAPLGELTAASPDNVRLRPQDRLELILKPRTFTAFGASGRVSEVSFQASQITLAEAIARVGGPLDQQADPAAVFVFRAAREPGAPSTINDAAGYFIAQRFVMRDKDLIYIANARTNSLSKALSILSSVVTPIVTAKTLSR
jgi:polysaccharide export outer membrane protein